MTTPPPDALLRTYRASKAYKKAVEEEARAAERLWTVEKAMGEGKLTHNGRPASKAQQERRDALELRQRRLKTAREELLATIA